MTGNFQNWTGEIAEIGPIYPFVGTEVVLVIAGFVFWIGWHILQFSVERREYEDDLRRSREQISKSLSS
jgi:hypothetical protein